MRIGSYSILDRINVGGMAEVFRAKTSGAEGFERVVAVKRLLDSMADDPECVRSFVEEARLAFYLTHPNIVQVYDLGKADDRYYIAMEYVRGRDLRQLMTDLRAKGRKLPSKLATYIAAQVCEGLDFAHRRCDVDDRPLKIVHRDVSPHNVLLGFDGQVKVADFGIATAAGRSRRTVVGMVKGKLGYMSPEQLRGESVDRRSDVFGVGILLYEMLTGVDLYPGADNFSILRKVEHASFVPPRAVNRALPRELEAIVLKALSLDPSQRYPSAAELHEELQPFLIDGTSFYTSRRLSAFLREEYGEGGKSPERLKFASSEVKVVPVPPTVAPPIATNPSRRPAAVTAPTRSLAAARDTTWFGPTVVDYQLQC